MTRRLPPPSQETPPAGEQKICTKCRVALAHKARPWCTQCTRISNRDTNRRYRQMALDHYGRVCRCCGETEEAFLALDHINNDGGARRKERRVLIGLWAKQNDYPPTLQVLCHNCNSAKGFYGQCPHVGPPLPVKRQPTNEERAARRAASEDDHAAP